MKSLDHATSFDGLLPTLGCSVLLPQLPISVRDLREEDSLHLEWHGGHDLRAWYRAQWQAHHSDRVRVLIADFNGFPIAQIAIHWHGKPTHSAIPDLQSFRVFEAFRGLGIGSLLLDCAEEVVFERGFTQVSLAVSVENARAQALYNRRGYEIWGTPYDDIWDYSSARGETVQVVERVQDMVKDLRRGA
jgi:GNAT superfamily N-acetyltransferase